MPAPPPVYEGTVLAGKYRVERVIGSGGMGVVVAAQHLALGERVAIKFLLPQAANNPEVIARFLREGRAAARVRSEHVARVFDVGTLDDGAPYLVMEYLEGSDLGAVLRAEGPLPVPVAVEYMLQACEALADAHALGVVHRDLKPSNLFLTQKSDGSPSIKLIDFGISKIMEQREGDASVTASAIMMGSPLFMAPEQMKSARDVDARADVWSMGGIFFALLTNRAPFLGETVMSIYDLILEGPPRASVFIPGVPPEIDAAIAGCLQRDASVRFADVAQIAAAIAAFGPPGSIERAARVQRILSAGRTAFPSGASTPQPMASPPARAASPPRPSTPVPGRSGPAASSGTREVASDGPWNSTQRPVKRRSAGLLLGLGIGGVAIVGAAAWFAFGRDTSSRAVATSTAETSSAPPAAVSAPTATAHVEPSSEATAVPSSDATAEAAEPTASARATAPRPSGRPKPAARPVDKPKRDLFEDPR